jgi:hypothetical protein
MTSFTLKDFEGGKPVEFQIANNDDGSAQFGIDTREWEPGDPKLRFRVPIFPLDMGLFENKLANRRGYQSSNADASWKNLLLFPPKINDLTFSTGTGPTKFVQFNNVMYAACGRYLWKVNSSLVASQVRDMGVGTSITDMVPFNNELVIAMGESERLWTMTTAESFTQATDATFAVSLGVSGKYLWRTESINRVSNCLTAPRTLTSWAPSTDANKYKVGTTTFSSNAIVDYGGTPYIAKPEGLFSADGLTNFTNQAPQIAAYPHADNGKGTFTAQGSLFCPTVQGLLRVRLGESTIKGPELTGRPSFRWHIHGGVEWGDSIYLLCEDHSSTSAPCIVKMMRDTMGGSQREYIYHEIARPADDGQAIAAFTSPTNPVLIFGVGNNAGYITLGRGAGRMIDDSSYAFGTSMTLDTGEISTADDLTVLSSLVGVSVLLNLPTAGDQVTVQAAFDRDDYQTLMTTYEGGGTAAITKTDGWEAPIRFAKPGSEGQQLKIRISGSTTASATGTIRPEIREAWALGYLRPKTTDVITVGLLLDSTGRGAMGRNGGLSRQELENFLKRQKTSPTPLLLETEGYDKTGRFLITDVRFTTASRVTGPGMEGYSRRKAVVTLTRIDFSGGYAK